MGIGVTFAEPAIGALQTAGSLVDVTKAPYLYTSQQTGSNTRSCCRRWRRTSSIKCYPIHIRLELKATNLYDFDTRISDYHLHGLRQEMAKVLGLADCGAVTTGPVTVPLVLSLGLESQMR